MSKKKYKSNRDDFVGKIKLTEDQEPAKQKINWFPGHMNKALKDIKSKIKMVDLIIEVRDARVPMHTGNPAMTELVGNKTKLIFFNKANFSSQQSIKSWTEWLNGKNINFFFGNILDSNDSKKLFSLAEKIVLDEYHKENPDGKKEKINLMIVGLPNTGKSTLINRIAKKNIAKAADKPGQTRHQQWIKITEQIQLLDTPGIMPPRIEEREHGLWLACINAIPTHIVSEEDSAFYLAQYFLDNRLKETQNYYQIKDNQSEAIELLKDIGQKRGCLMKGGEIDLERVYRIFLTDFRAGNLSKVCFESPLD